MDISAIRNGKNTARAFIRSARENNTENRAEQKNLVHTRRVTGLREDTDLALLLAPCWISIFFTSTHIQRKILHSSQIHIVEFSFCIVDEYSIASAKNECIFVYSLRYEAFNWIK